MSLGKTNITTLSEGAIVTEVEDFKWLQMQSGVLGNFVKAIYKNGYLVAITADGMVVYTTDGETWQTSTLEYADCKLNDIEWDGSRFILVGSYSVDSITAGLILATNDFNTYEIVRSDKEINSFWVVYPQNGKYIVLGNTGLDMNCLVGNLVNDEWKKKILVNSHYIENYPHAVSSAKSTDGFLFCLMSSRSESNTVYDTYYIYKINNDGVLLNAENMRAQTTERSVLVFECKDTLFYLSTQSQDNYKFAKILSSGEKIILSTDINYRFVDGVYFNECQIFINHHEMLVVKKGENIADKTLDNLIEIAPELTMNCITKAFGQLYIFGNQGVILKSSVETNNDEAVTVQALSAKRALGEAKAYTDQQYALLEARIAALEGAPETK